jgi:hypothetical protein
MAHTAKPLLDESPFRCFIVILLWLQNSPSFAQTELLPTHAWPSVTLTGLFVMLEVIDGHRLVSVWTSGGSWRR